MQECLNVLCENQQKVNSDLINSKASIIIAPNPATGMVSISVETDMTVENLNINVIDVNGKIVRSFISELNVATFQFDTSALSSGTYFVQLYNGNSLLQTKKLIVQ